MHSYKILTMSKGLFDDLTVKLVIDILRRGLKEDDLWDSFELFFRTRLVEEMGDHFMCGLNDMGSFYFINVFSRGRKNIMIRATRLKMVTLKDIAAYTVGRDISEEDDVHTLGIPISLYGDVKKYVGCI